MGALIRGRVLSAGRGPASGAALVGGHEIMRAWGGSRSASTELRSPRKPALVCAPMRRA